MKTTYKIFLTTILINSFFNFNLNAIEILEVEMLDSYKVSRDFPGKLLPSEQSRLAFEIPGKIKSLNVDVGDKVKKGQVLAELDDREAVAQLNQSKAKYDLAVQVLNRFKDLRTKGHISIQDLDRANSEELVAKSQYEFYKVKFEQTKLLAPFDGVVQDRYLDTGSVINGGIPILEILDSKNVKAHISIPISYIDKIKIGDSYNFDIGDTSAKAKLQRLAPMSLGGSNNRLAVFVFDTFFNPGSVATLKLNTIEKGRGYVPAEENKKSSAAIGTIFTDSIFTPIKNVKYSVENFRVEQKTDYEKLVFEIMTDGSINPQDALTDAARILIHHFMLFSDERITLEADEIAKTETYDEESLHMRQLLKTKLIDMDLSVRALNCLKAAEVDTLGDLVSFNKNDLMKFRNFGKKSLTELEELVNIKGLSFGMDLSKYKLDKD